MDTTVDEARKLTLKKYRVMREVGYSMSNAMKMVIEDANWVVTEWNPGEYLNSITPEPTETIVEDIRSRAALIGYWGNRYLQTHRLLTD